MPKDKSGVEEFFDRIFLTKEQIGLVHALHQVRIHDMELTRGYVLYELIIWGRCATGMDGFTKRSYASFALELMAGMSDPEFADAMNEFRFRERALYEPLQPPTNVAILKRKS